MLYRHGRVGCGRFCEEQARRERELSNAGLAQVLVSHRTKARLVPRQLEARERRHSPCLCTHLTAAATATVTSLLATRRVGQAASPPCPASTQSGPCRATGQAGVPTSLAPEGRALRPRPGLSEGVQRWAVRAQGKSPLPGEPALPRLPEPTLSASLQLPTLCPRPRATEPVPGAGPRLAVSARRSPGCQLPWGIQPLLGSRINGLGAVTSPLWSSDQRGRKRGADKTGLPHEEVGVTSPQQST